MLKFIRQLVQKLNKDKKVETQDSSSHSNGNTHVVRSPKFVENNIKEKKKNSQIEFSDDLSTKGD